MTDWTPLLESLADSGNLSKACRETGLNKSTFLLAVSNDTTLADQYARAREVGLDTEADRAIEEAASAEDAAKGRLLLDARKWYLSKLLPKRYGDKTTTELTGADGGPVQVTEVRRVIVDPNAATD